MPGCGLALLRMAAAVEAAAQSCEGDERTGLRMLAHALEAPTRQIAENSALENAVSVASVLLLTEATMTEAPEKKSEAPSPQL